MYPFNLHRNIAQLDRQISLLEKECKDMELVKKWKSQKIEPTHTTCSRNSNLAIKPPSVKVNVKKSDNSKKIKKPTPPTSTRIRTTGSLPARCSKNCGETGDILQERKGKSYGSNSKVAVGSSQSLETHECNLRSEKKCLCHYAAPVTDLGTESLEPKKKDHVVRFPNAGGTIEVTVTQKPLEEGNSSKCQITFSERDVGNYSDSCRCQKGQKWSEILSLDSARNRQSGSENFIKSKVVEGKKTSQQNLNHSKQSDINVSQNDSGIKEETFEIPVKLPSQLGKTKGESETNTSKFEKEVQCSLENYIKDSKKEFKEPSQIFQLLVKQLQNMSIENLKNSPLNATNYMKIKDPTKVEFEASKFNISSEICPENSPSYINTMKHHFEILMKEKAVLTNDLEAKDKTIATMKQREAEYLSLINSLKANLEKAKCNAQEGVATAKEINVLKNKFQEEMKASKSLKQRIYLVQRALEQCSLENDTLKTQIKILKLEAQKHVVLLAGKDAEIKKYREEIQNFHQQINEHLSTLKSNSQAVDVEKMMEAIMQQSQIFALTDLESLDREGKDSSRGQNVLMHSSPTSTKTSEVNSSWKQISSIYDRDESKAESEVIYLNQDENEKNFFEVFGGNTGCPEETKPENPQEKEDVKYSSSFTSCVSLREDDNRSDSTRDSLISPETTLKEDGLGREQLRGGSGMSEDKAQSNIDELLKVMKLKFSKEIFNNSFPSCTTGDYLELSQISSISQL